MSIRHRLVHTKAPKPTVYLYVIQWVFYDIGEIMIEISESKFNEIKRQRFKVYSKGPLTEGCECFSSRKSFADDEPFCITSVNIANIKHDNGKFYYTTEDLSEVADWFPAHVLDVSNNFIPCKKSKKLKCASKVGNNVGKSIKSDKCVVDVSGMPAFNGVNEDLSVYEYRFYLTLFNDYTVKQCHYERRNLHDAIFKSSKYDLPSKLQNSDFLKSKDFTMINVRREKEESVPVGLIIKEDDNKYNLEYGKVYINMDNKISIIWH